MVNSHAIVLYTHGNIDFRPALICAARDARKIQNCGIFVSGYKGDQSVLGKYIQEARDTFGADIAYHEILIPQGITAIKTYKVNTESNALKKEGFGTLTCVDNDIIFPEGTIIGQLGELKAGGLRNIVGPKNIRYVPPSSTKFFYEYAAQNSAESLETFPELESGNIYHRAMRFFIEKIMKKDVSLYQFQPPHLSGAMMTACLDNLPQIPSEYFAEDAYFAAHYFPNVRFSGKIYHPELVRYTWSKNPIFEYQGIIRSYLKFSKGNVRKFLEYMDRFEKHTPGSKHATFSDWMLFVSVLALGFIKHHVAHVGASKVVRSYK
jgi:hypothetical protein